MYGAPITPTDVRRQTAALLLIPQLLGEAPIKPVADSASEAAADRIQWITTD
ncbi:hypothetical protein AB0D74_30535 [Streptomyces sp. NPDC048278]|uniref:hypothetical protein n=1 Tax=Streptomyces sp. NPDC048278 TaxID=3155809 RepID=UPI003421D910